MTAALTGTTVRENSGFLALAAFVAYLVGGLMPDQDPSVISGALAVGVARLLGVIAVFPLFTENEVKGPIPLVVALALGWPIIATGFQDLPALNLSAPHLFFLVAKEFLCGCLIAAVLGAPFWALQAAAHLIDFSRDASMPNVANPSTAEETTPLGPVFLRCALAIFVANGGFTDLTGLVYASYEPWPAYADAPLSVEPAVAYVFQITDKVWATAFVHCAPVCLLILLVELPLALSQRMYGKLPVHESAGYLKNLVTAFALLLFAAFYDGWTVDVWREYAAGAANALSLAP